MIFIIYYWTTWRSFDPLVFLQKLLVGLNIHHGSIKTWKKFVKTKNTQQNGILLSITYQKTRKTDKTLIKLAEQLYETFKFEQEGQKSKFDIVIKKFLTYYRPEKYVIHLRSMFHARTKEIVRVYWNFYKKNSID